MARYGAESATFGGVVFKRANIWGGCFGYWKIQNGPSVFHIDPLHGLIWPRCKGQFSPKFWYQNSPISVGLNWPQKQYHSGLTRFGPIFGAKLALFILQCSFNTFYRNIVKLYIVLLIVFLSHFLSNFNLKYSVFDFIYIYPDFWKRYRQMDQSSYYKN